MGHYTLSICSYQHFEGVGGRGKSLTQSPGSVQSQGWTLILAAETLKKRSASSFETSGTICQWRGFVSHKVRDISSTAVRRSGQVSPLIRCVQKTTTGTLSTPAR